MNISYDAQQLFEFIQLKFKTEQDYENDKRKNCVFSLGLKLRNVSAAETSHSELILVQMAATENADRHSSTDESEAVYKLNIRRMTVKRNVRYATNRYF